MGIFGEAIHGHIGFYKTAIYGASINAGQIVPAQGLSQQDVNNVILSTVSVGPNDSENQIIMLDPDRRGVSWSLRIAAQTDSMVSTGFSHIAYWQSTLSAFRNVDTMVYFPFITDGNVCKHLLQNEEQFNLSRWHQCVQGAQRKKEYQVQSLGGEFVLPRDLLRLAACYILGRVGANARKYLYILVPQGAEYQAYCEAVICQILSAIPYGLRKGITFATNTAVKDEEHYGIIFQRETNPARHGCDLSFHRAGNYSFLQDYYLGKNVESLIALFVDNPGMAEICYREMEQPLFGDELPGQNTPYDSYYGISQLHINKDRPEYLEECDTLLRQTQGNTQQRKLVENAIRTEIGNKDICLHFIEQDKDYVAAKEGRGINAYVNNRRNLAEFLNTIGIDFESLFLYKKLEEISLQNNCRSAAEVYEYILHICEELTEVSASQKELCCQIAFGKAWKEFEECIPPYMIPLQENPDGTQIYTPEIVETLLNTRNNISGWGLEDAFIHYEKLERLGFFEAPASMSAWYCRMKRVEALHRLYMMNSAGFNMNETLHQLDLVFEKKQGNESGRDSLEAGAALDWVQELYIVESTTKRTPQDACKFEEFLIKVHKLCLPIYKIRKENEDRQPYKEALYNQMTSYLNRSSNPDMYARAIEVANVQLVYINQDYLNWIYNEATEQINNPSIPDSRKIAIYNAVKRGGLSRDLRIAFENWAISKYENEPENSNLLEEIYASADKPSKTLKGIYIHWKNNNDEKRRIEDMIMTSKTYVRYIEAVLSRKSEISDSEAKRARGEFWSRLTHEERDFSAFIGAVSYVVGEEPMEFLRSSSREAHILLDEFDELVGTKGTQMGLLLTREETLQELYQRAVSYQKLTNKNIRLIPLYSLGHIEGMRNLGYKEDGNGREATGLSVGINDFVETLRVLIMLQNKLYERDEIEKDIRNLKRSSGDTIIQFLGRAGVIDNKGDLLQELANYNIVIGNRGSSEGDVGFDIRKVIPYVGWGLSAVLLVLLVISRLFSGKPDPSVPRSWGEASGISHGDDSTAVETGKDLSDQSGNGLTKEKDDSVMASADHSVPEGNNATDSTPENTDSSTQDTVITPFDSAEGSGQESPKEVIYQNGVFITNRVRSENIAALRMEVGEGDEKQIGYDLNGDNTIDLYPVYVHNEQNQEVFSGFGFQTGKVVHIRPVKDEATGNTIGFDLSGDNMPDSVIITAENNEPLGYDIDNDGMCDIDYHYEEFF